MPSVDDLFSIFEISYVNKDRAHVRRTRAEKINTIEAAAIIQDWIA